MHRAVKTESISVSGGGGGARACHSDICSGCMQYDMAAFCHSISVLMMCNMHRVDSKLSVHLSGADGSVRMFDLRHLEHSTIIYEDPQHQPLLRLAWNKQDPNYLATMAMDALEVGFNDIAPKVVYSKIFFHMYGVMLQHTETDTVVLHSFTH